MNFENFIKIYKTEDKICDELIYYHKKNKEYKSEGKIQDKDGIKLNKDIKDSIDVNFFNTSRNVTILKFFKILSNSIQEYIKYYEINLNLHTEMANNIQYYPPGGGFKKWHCERSNKHDVNRQLVYMLYLNNVIDGGTEFKYQNIITQAIKGNLIIWPSDFTHTHRGIISNTQEKYIATGWINII
jgi:hypothetical protein